MPSYTWEDVRDGNYPNEGQVVNVLAACRVDGKRKQFMATYTSWTRHGKVNHVWTPLGGDMLMFDSSTVSEWTPRLEMSSQWVYKGCGD